ncbi:class I SAM-dependent methyltransferase [Halopiger goleimassiliensis]|uniref:class I SAM-dependent methyltransferase n=1 Tax=Halopiger goleimassiliensis TaxID=1293048 RepID=UPI0009DB9947|nr:class I SAM-dependent methyltransferase [Halopiger goleimassiliensis]
MTTNESAQHGGSQPTGDRDSIGSRSKSVPEIREAVADHVDEMDGSSTVNRLLTARYRRRHFARASGRVLDVACGSGTNVEYLPEDVTYVGVDISPEMLARAADRFERLRRGESLYEMNAQDLAFDDDSFDTVISSMSTCMFPDPVVALEEMARVCASDGKILLLEHGRSSVGPIARLQDWRAEPRYEKTGCRWNQEPLAVVSRSNLVVEGTTTGMLGMVTTITARPPDGD